MYTIIGALAVRRAHFGQGSGLILEVVLCFGHEETLTACDYHDANDGICNHGEDAGVQCCKQQLLLSMHAYDHNCSHVYCI